jgi:hypothetical protein
MVDLTDLNTYLNGRLILDPPVKEIFKDVRKIEWIPRSIDEEVAKLESVPGNYYLEVPITSIEKVDPLPQEADGIKRGTLFLYGSYRYDGHKFNFQPNERKALKYLKGQGGIAIDEAR